MASQPMRLQLPEKPSDRLVMALVGPFFVLMLGLPLVGLFSYWKPTGLLEYAAKLVVEEVLGTFTAVFALITIWSIFRPGWVRKLMDKLAGRFVYGSAILVFGGVTLLVIVEALRVFVWSK